MAESSKVALSISLDLDQALALNAEVEQRRTTRSQIVREALTLFFSRNSSDHAIVRPSNLSKDATDAPA